MLKLPPQVEKCCFTASSGQLNEAESALCCRRKDHNVTICRPGGGLQATTRFRSQRWYTHEREEVFVEAKAANLVVHQSWRLKRSLSRRCKLRLNQQIRGIVRDGSAAGTVLVPVSYTIAPALDKSGRVLSTSCIDDKETFLTTLVVSAPLMVPSSDMGDTLMRNVEHKEEGGSPAGHLGDERSHEPKRVNGRKQNWRLDMERLRIPPEMERKRDDWASHSDHNRELEEKILLLESFDVDTTKALAFCPSIVNTGIEDLKSVIQHLESCGLRRADLGRILSMTPQILELSVENHLRLAVRFLLKEVGLHQKELRKVIRRCPRLLVASVDSQLRPTMHFLQSLGFSCMASLISNNATILTFSIQSKLLPKLDFLQTLGMSRDEAVSLVLRFPAIFNYGVEQNLQPKYDYLAKVMGLNVSHLKAFPQYFGYSLDYRIRQRHEFLHERNIRVPFPIFLKLSDEEFYSRFKGSRVRDVGEKRKLAADLDTQAVDDAGEKQNLEIHSQEDEGGEKEKQKLAVLSKTEEPNPTRRMVAVMGA